MGFKGKQKEAWVRQVFNSYETGGAELAARIRLSPGEKSLMSCSFIRIIFIFFNLIC